MEIFFVLLIAACVLSLIGFDFYRSRQDEIKKEAEREKRQKEDKLRKEELKRKKEQEKKEAYNTISDIWEYGEKTTLAVYVEDGVGHIAYVNIEYSASKDNEWTIVFNDQIHDVQYIQAKRSSDFILGVKDKIVLKLTKGQFILDGKVFYYDTKNEYVKKAKENIKRCMTGKKIVTVRAEHVNSLLKSDIDINNLIAELPKFHFTISNKGIKCDEVNYAKMALDNYFIMNDGGEVMCENRVYYDYYCKYGDLPFFSLEDYYTYDEFISELSHLNTKLNRESRLNFEFSEWQTAIITGINRLFKSMRTYEREGRLDLVPITFAGDVISFRHKIYKSIDKKSDVQRDYILKVVEKQRMDAANGGKLPYWISYPKDEMGIIQINDDSYIIVDTLKNYNIH